MGTPFFIVDFGKPGHLGGLAFSSGSLRSRYTRPTRRQYLNQFDRKPRCTAGVACALSIAVYGLLACLFGVYYRQCPTPLFLSYKMIARDIHGCSRQVGFCAIYKPVSGFGFILPSSRIQSRPLAANANRWAGRYWQHNVA